MKFIRNVWEKILALFGIKTQTSTQEYTAHEVYENNYEDIHRINFNAIFSNKLSNYACNQSIIELQETNKRAELLADVIKKTDKDKKRIVSRMLGTGGVVLVPYVSGGELLYTIVPQYRLSINEVKGGKITNGTILADTKTEKQGFTTKYYYRWSNYIVKGSNIIITQKYTDENGEEIPKPDVYMDIEDKIGISNVDRALFGYFKSPIDNRKSTNYYGVPITYGCSQTISEIYECLDQIRREFKLKEAFVGADVTMFNGENGLPENGLYRKVNSNDDNFWEVFDPAIRESSYYARLQELYERLEREIGTSKGILSSPETANATATEIRKALYDTFTIVEEIRESFEKGLNDFLYSCNVLANYYNLSPLGEYEIKYDWSFEMLENTEETYSQLLTGYDKGVVDEVELRQFLFPSEELDVSEKKIEEIKEKQPKMEDMLGITNE